MNDRMENNWEAQDVSTLDPGLASYQLHILV